MSGEHCMCQSKVTCYLWDPRNFYILQMWVSKVQQECYMWELKVQYFGSMYEPPVSHQLMLHVLIVLAVVAKIMTKVHMTA